MNVKQDKPTELYRHFDETCDGHSPASAGEVLQITVVVRLVSYHLRLFIRSSPRKLNGLVS